MAETFVIAQGGGPTAVINQTLVGAALEVRKRHPGAKVLGARHGVRGIRDGDYVDLSALPEAELRLIAGTPSAALGSTRDKPDAAYCDVILDGLKKAGADAFIYIGGNDTAGTQQILTDAAGGSMAFVHAPKTIDNDLVENDHTPGFISAAEFVAGAFLSVDLDFRALPGIYVGIVMGRHAGFLTAAAGGLAARRGQRPASRLCAGARLLGAALHRRRARHARPPQALHRRRVGRRADRGRPPLVESLVPPDRLERDAHGNVKLSGSDLGLAFEQALAEGLPGKRARVDTLGYMPRGYIGCINKIDRQEAFDAGALRGRGGRARAAARSRCSIDGEQDRAQDRAAVERRRQDPAHARRFPDADENQLSETGMAYLNRLVPKKFEVGKPFV